MTVIETPVSHSTAAQELVEKIRSMQALVPGFELLPLPLDRFQRPRGHQSLPDSFFTPLELALKRAPRFAESVAPEAVLLESIAQGQRGERIPADELLREMRSRECRKFFVSSSPLWLRGTSLKQSNGGG